MILLHILFIISFLIFVYITFIYDGFNKNTPFIVKWMFGCVAMVLWLPYFTFILIERIEKCQKRR